MPNKAFDISDANFKFAFSYLVNNVTTDNFLPSSFNGGSIKHQEAKATLIALHNRNETPSVKSLSLWCRMYLSRKGFKRLQNAYNQQRYRNKTNNTKPRISISNEAKQALDDLVIIGYAENFSDCILKMVNKLNQGNK